MKKAFKWLMGDGHVGKVLRMAVAAGTASAVATADRHDALGELLLVAARLLAGP